MYIMLHLMCIRLHFMYIMLHNVYKIECNNEVYPQYTFCTFHLLHYHKHYPLTKTSRKEMCVIMMICKQFVYSKAILMHMLIMSTNFADTVQRLVILWSYFIY